MLTDGLGFKYLYVHLKIIAILLSSEENILCQCWQETVFLWPVSASLRLVIVV